MELLLAVTLAIQLLRNDSSRDVYERWHAIRHAWEVLLWRPSLCSSIFNRPPLPPPWYHHHIRTAYYFYMKSRQLGMSSVRVLHLRTVQLIFT
jgi:hypothetical protein